MRFNSILLHAPIKLLQFVRKINENDIFSSDTNCYVGGIISGGKQNAWGRVKLKQMNSSEYDGKILTPTCKINFVKMQHNNVHKRRIYSNIHNYVDVQHNLSRMFKWQSHMLTWLCYMSANNNVANFSKGR